MGVSGAPEACAGAACLAATGCLARHGCTGGLTSIGGSLVLLSSSAFAATGLSPGFAVAVPCAFASANSGRQNAIATAHDFLTSKAGFVARPELELSTCPPLIYPRPNSPPEKTSSSDSCQNLDWF